MSVCECGCGKATGTIKQTDTARGLVAGQHFRFARGHRGPTPRYEVEDRGYTSPCWIWQRALLGSAYRKQPWAT